MDIIAIILLALVVIALIAYVWDFGNTIEDIMTQLEAVTDELNSIRCKLEDEDYMDPSEYCEPEDYCDPLAITASSSDDDEDLLF